MGKYSGVSLQHIYTLGERDGWQCHYCGAALRPADQPPTVFKMIWTRPATPEGQPRRAYIPLNYNRAYADHVVPRVQGGRTIQSNLVLACGTCNSRKRGTPYQEYVAQYPAALPLPCEVQL